MMEAVSISETPVNFHQTTRRNIPEKSSYYSFLYRSDNLMPVLTSKSSFYDLS
jgi:hypothetical protein